MGHARKQVKGSKGLPGNRQRCGERQQVQITSQQDGQQKFKAKPLKSRFARP
jgi:hypothetical protein